MCPFGYTPQRSFDSRIGRPIRARGGFVVLPMKSLAAVASALAFGFCLTVAQSGAQDKPQEKKKEWKSQDEYNLYDAAQKDANAATRIDKLNKWKQAFPESDFAEGRSQMYLVAYEQANDPRKAFDTA